jgi:hypothetical protein
MLPLCVLGAESTVVEAFDTTRLGVRASQPLPQTPGPPLTQAGRILFAGDASTSAGARLRVTDRRWIASLAYTISATETDFELIPVPGPQVVQTGTVYAAWHDRFWTVALSQSGTYSPALDTHYLYYTVPQGTTEATAPTTTTTTTPGQGMPPMQRTGPGSVAGPTQMPGGTTQPNVQQTTVHPHSSVVLGSSVSDLSVSARIGRRTLVLVDGGYQVYGGLTTDSKFFYPVQYGSAANAGVYYRAGRDDTFSISASESETFTTNLCLPPASGLCHETVPIVYAQFGYRRQLPDRAYASAMLGISESIIQTQGLAQNHDELVLLPIATVTYSTGLARSASDQLVLTMQTVPTVDFLTGALSFRAIGLASWIQKLEPWCTVTATFGLTQSLPFPNAAHYVEPSPLTLLSGGVEVRFRLDRQIDLTVSEQDFWQNQSGYGTLATELGYVGITVRTPPLRL